METQIESKYLASGVVLDNKYTIVRHLASGGFGNTYLATDRMGKHVVVKEFYLSGVCTRGSDSRSVSITVEENKAIYKAQKDKFIKEARRINQLSGHPHIVKVSDFFEENETAYYVMDYIKGSSLAQVDKPLAEPLVMHYLNQILSALEYVHLQGILHLDIKPNNIMIDNHGNAILIDFGASKQYDADSATHSILTTTTGVAYTPGYAPFEQMSNHSKNLGTHSDIYSLGATLYNLLTGLRPPLPSDILENGIPHLELVSPRMRVLLTKAMSVSVGDRIKTVAELKALLPNSDATTISDGDDTCQDTLLPPTQKGEATEKMQQTGGNSNGSQKGNSSRRGGVFLLALIIAGLIFAIAFKGIEGLSLFDGDDSAAASDSALAIPDSVPVIGPTGPSGGKFIKDSDVSPSDGNYYYYGSFTHVEEGENPVSIRFESKNGKIVNCVYKNETLGGKIKMNGKWTPNGLYFVAKKADYLNGKRVDFTITLRSNDEMNNYMTGDAYVGEKHLKVKLEKIDEEN